MTEPNVSLSRSAGLLIEIFPIGIPGQVGMAVHNVGPEVLSKAEALHVLRDATRQLEESELWTAELSPSLPPWLRA